MAKLITTSGMVLDVQPENGSTFTLGELRRYIKGWIIPIKTLDPAVIMYVSDLDRHGINLDPNDIGTRIYWRGETPDFAVRGDVLLADITEFDKASI